MTHLLDTNVLSELRRKGSNPQVRAWISAHSTHDLWISVVSVMEIEFGVLLVERRDPDQGVILRRWLEERVLPGFEGRILPVDVEVARATAQLHVPDRSPERDALIAGTALVHDLTVVTRNVADFERSGVKLVNPWEDQ